jgi:hypothetical protein
MPTGRPFTFARGNEPMAPADDNPSTPVRRDIQALYVEYQKTTDLVRSRQLLSEIYAGYLELARDDIWLLLCDACALSVGFCGAPEAAERLLLETAHEGGFPHWRWRPSNESLRGASPQHRGIDPRLWGKSDDDVNVHYPVDWKNSAVAYVRLEVSPYSPEGVALERLGDFLPAEPDFQINLVRLPLRDVLTMLHRNGLLPDAPRRDVGVVQHPIGGQTADAVVSDGSLSVIQAAHTLAAAGSASPPFKVEREEWLNKYLTKECQNDLSMRHNGITSAATELHDLMLKDSTVEAYARARNIERHPIVRNLFPPGRSSKKKKS